MCDAALTCHIRAFATFSSRGHGLSVWQASDLFTAPVVHLSSFRAFAMSCPSNEMLQTVVWELREREIWIAARWTLEHSGACRVTQLKTC